MKASKIQENAKDLQNVSCCNKTAAKKLKNWLYELLCCSNLFTQCSCAYKDACCVYDSRKASKLKGSKFEF